MKEWFKYEFGYVNIDDENLYFTSSGNWSETIDLNEKTKKGDAKNNSRSFSIIGFIVVAICLFGFLIFKSILSGRVGFTLIVITLAGSYKLYEYLKTEIGPKFRVPLDKISEIRAEEKNIEIIFENGEGMNDSYKIYKIEQKGFAIMLSLKDIILKS